MLSPLTGGLTPLGYLVRGGYILQDEFTTSGSAPLASPRTCEPGPGQLVIGDPNSKISIAADKLQMATGSTSSTTFVFSNAIVIYQAGVAVKHVGYKDASGATVYIGWGTANSAAGSGVERGTLQPGFYRGVANGGSVAIPASIDSTARDYVMVRNADGGMWVFRDYHLIMVDRGVLTSNLYAEVLGSQSTTGTPVLDAVRVRVLGSVWAQSEGIAAVSSSASSNTNYAAAPADGIHEISFTQPGSPASGDKIELRVRVADASNYITVFLIWNAGTSQWDLQLWKNVAGTLSQIGATVVNVGTVTNLMIQIVGITATVWTRSSSTNQGTRRIAGAAVPSSSQASATPVVAQGSWTLSHIWSYSDTQMPDGTLYSDAAIGLGQI